MPYAITAPELGETLLYKCGFFARVGVKEGEAGLLKLDHNGMKDQVMKDEEPDPIMSIRRTAESGSKNS